MTASPARFLNRPREANPGDVLLLSSLRLDRLQSMDGSDLPPQVKTRDAGAKQEAETEALALLKPLTERGVRIVFTAPMPVFRIASFRCSDWFNRTNPVCRNGFEVVRAEFDGQRNDVLASMEYLRGELPGVSIWDPSTEFCEAVRCSVMRDDKPMFFDGDHLSGWGNDLLWPGFQRHMSAVAPGSVAARAPR